MASDWTVLGRVPDIDGHEVEASLHVSGAVALNDAEWTLVLGSAGQAELLDRAAMPGQPQRCAYCEDDPDHPDPDNAGTCTCRAPGCGRGWCPKRDDEARDGA